MCTQTNQLHYRRGKGAAEILLPIQTKAKAEKDVCTWTSSWVTPAGLSRNTLKDVLLTSRIHEMTHAYSKRGFQKG